MEDQKIGTLGWFLIGIFLISLIYAGHLSYKGIDFDILKRLEAQKLVLP